MFNCIGSTCINENGFKEQRRGEQKTSNAKVSNQSKWSNLFLSQAAENKFEYHELPGWRDEVVDPGMKGKSQKALYHGSVRDSTPGLKQVVGTTHATPWHSPAPSREARPDLDFDLCRVAERFGAWEKMQKAWLGCLLAAPQHVGKL